MLYLPHFLFDNIDNQKKVYAILKSEPELFICLKTESPNIVWSRVIEKIELLGEDKVAEFIREHIPW